MKKLPITDADAIEFGKVMRKTNLFASISIGLAEKILNRVNVYQYDKDEKVCRQGGEGDSFYVVKEGRLRVSVREGFVFSKVIASLAPGDCFGEMALLKRAPRNATVTCEENSKLFVLLADSFAQALGENPAFAEEMKKIASERGFELKHH
ncbi:MAG TPA: hypothetical protein DCL44_01640 [Elusimicrobia bacterium]|nr:hypothetical protein [Elusimicrobiota bacterium]